MEPVNILENVRKLFNAIIGLLLTLFPSVVLIISTILFIFLALVFIFLTGTTL